MKPVDKGAPPRDALGQEIIYPGEEGHQKAKRSLHERLGRYCSYCERCGDLHVEHVIPKKKHDEVKHLWVNYLLACNNCNGTKKEKDPLVLEWDCLFPDEVNTGWAFIYGPGAQIAINPRLSHEDQQRARKTLEMVGLENHLTLDPKAADLRWQDRDSAWRQAEDALADLMNEDRPIVRKHIAIEAEKTGFFSVWWTVFGLDMDAPRRAEMRNQFIAKFRVRTSCYNADGSIRQTL